MVVCLKAARFGQRTGGGFFLSCTIAGRTEILQVAMAFTGNAGSGAELGKFKLIGIAAIWTVYGNYTGTMAG